VQGTVDPALDGRSLKNDEVRENWRSLGKPQDSVASRVCESDLH